MPVYKDEKSNCWFYKCCVHRHQYLKRGFKTKKEALSSERIFLQNLGEKNTYVLFSELVDEYLNHQKKILKPTTYYGYCIRFNKYIIPNFKDINIEKLTMDDFKRFRSILSKSNIKTKNRILDHVVKLFDFASEYLNIFVPYAKRLEKFKDYTPSMDFKEANKPVSINTLKEYYRCSNDFFRFYLLTTYIFGLRISEVRGLSIDSFDLSNRILYIYKVTTGKCGLNKSLDLVPKSSSSIRRYYLPSLYYKKLLTYIREHGLNNHDRIFYSNEKSNPISETTIRSYLLKIEKENKLEHITPHGLRHGIATYLYSLGISYEDIGKYLGHKFGSVTMDVYIDLTFEKQKKILKVLDELIKKIELD